MDYFKDIETLRLLSFINKVPFYGVAIIPQGKTNIRPPRLSLISTNQTRKTKKLTSWLILVTEKRSPSTSHHWIRRIHEGLSALGAQLSLYSGPTTLFSSISTFCSQFVCQYLFPLLMQNHANEKIVPRQATTTDISVLADLSLSPWAAPKPTKAAARIVQKYVARFQ